MSEAVVSTRIRLARNLKDYPFPNRISEAQAKEVTEKVISALSDTKQKFNRIDMSELSQAQRLALVEQHLISPEFVEKRPYRVLLLSDDNSVSIMLNEEDHIRLQVIKPGLDLEEAYKVADEIDNCLAKNINLAFSERLGYLTQCPTNLGTALRASVMLHLPALQKSSSISRIASNLSKLGLTIRGIYGEGSNSSGALYQLSNQVTLGISEKAAVENLKNIANQLISQEIKTRDKMLKDIEVQDKICRSLGILKSAKLISHTEAMELISNVRLGVSGKLLDTLSLDSIDKLTVEIQPANIMIKHGEEMSVRERDVKRADILRERFK